MFSSEYCEIFKNNFFEEYLWTTAFVTLVAILSFIQRV